MITYNGAKLITLLDYAVSRTAIHCCTIINLMDGEQASERDQRTGESR